MKRLLLLTVLCGLGVFSWTPASHAGCFGHFACGVPCYEICSVPCGPIDYPPGVIIDVPPGTIDIPPGTIDVPPGTIDVPPGTGYRPGTDRTWVYGASPRVLIGRLRGMQDGKVSIASARRGTVEIPIEALSRIDQKIVVTQLAIGNRVWTDDSGRYHRAATFVRFDGRKVHLKTQSGKTLNVAFHQLSAADRCIVTQLANAPVLDEVVPAGAELIAQQVATVR